MRPGSSRPEGVEMTRTTTTTTRQQACPQDCCAGNCGGELVTWAYAKYVRVAPCSALLAQGWNNKVQAVYYHSQVATMPVSS